MEAQAPDFHSHMFSPTFLSVMTSSAYPEILFSSSSRNLY